MWREPGAEVAVGGIGALGTRFDALAPRARKNSRWLLVKVPQLLQSTNQAPPCMWMYHLEALTVLQQQTLVTVKLSKGEKKKKQDDLLACWIAG
jgi:hypothetical protein